MHSKKRTIMKITGIIALLCCVSVISYSAGKRSSRGVDTKTFYAAIESISDDYLVVQGLAVNDINGRGYFKFTIDESTIIEWHNTEIEISDLHAGDTISITYSGPVAESDPAGIENILKIILLEDEKQDGSVS